MGALSACQKLTELDCQNNIHTDAGLRACGTITNLVTLWLGEVRSPDGLVTLLEGCKSLQSLDFQAWAHLHDGVFEALEVHPTLTALGLRYCCGPVDDTLTLSLAGICCLTDLSLEGWHCRAVTDVGIRALAGCELLSRLEISSELPKVSEAALEELWEHERIEFEHEGDFENQPNYLVPLTP